MNFRKSSLLLIGALLLLQTVFLAADDRRVKTQVAPAYPEIAKRAHLAGSVRMEVTIEPNGSVREAKVLGGSPILVESAVSAVKQWKYEAAKDVTTTVVVVNFSPQ